MWRRTATRLVVILGLSLGISCSQTSAPTASTQNHPGEAAPIPISKAAPTIATANPSISPATPAAMPSPNIDQVRAAVARVFQKAATVDSESNPIFATGDFNGDGSEDLAVAVKATDAALNEINSELANWLVEDPRMIAADGTAVDTRMPPQRPARVDKGESLLAIIHGVGAQGWHAADARQTYLLKNKGGVSLQVTPAQAAATKARVPRGAEMRGDRLNEVIAGKPGMIIWTGARYSWQPTPR